MVVRRLRSNLRLPGSKPNSIFVSCGDWEEMMNYLVSVSSSIHGVNNRFCLIGWSVLVYIRHLKCAERCTAGPRLGESTQSPLPTYRWQPWHWRGCSSCSPRWRTHEWSTPPLAPAPGWWWTSGPQAHGTAFPGHQHGWACTWWGTQWLASHCPMPGLQSPLLLLSQWGLWEGTLREIRKYIGGQEYICCTL